MSRLTLGEQEKLVQKTITWFRNTSYAITKAGGSPHALIDRIPADVLYTLIANDLFIEYLGLKEPTDG